MSATTEHTQAQLDALARHLAQTHDNILDAWRALANSDNSLAPSTHLTRTQFINHIPRIINALCIRFRTWPHGDTAAQRQLELEAVQSHSHHRWQMGYNMRALVRDWGHLNVCLLQELDSYGRRHADAQLVALPEARQVWAKIVNDSIAQSAVEYHELLQGEATMRLNDLATVLERMREMELMRGHDLRTATHDLRGSLSILSSSVFLLGDARISQAERAKVSDILTQGINTLYYMFEELMDMARLEAAQDPRRMATFDVGQIFTELCATSQALAGARGLSLKAAGPARLLMWGDQVKTRRIAQNLLLNALKYTQEGGVIVTWQEQPSNQLLLCIQDSGPGLEGDAAVLAGQPHGEGVGLSIVRRLCEVLEAKIKVDSQAGTGTTFQVRFPLEYSD